MASPWVVRMTEVEAQARATSSTTRAMASMPGPGPAVLLGYMDPQQAVFLQYIFVFPGNSPEASIWAARGANSWLLIFRMLSRRRINSSEKLKSICPFLPYVLDEVGCTYSNHQ